MCGHYMVSEASAPRFVFRSRTSPACASECVKMQFHVSARNQKQRYLRWILVFLMCAHQRSCVPSRMCVKASLLDVNKEQNAKCECLSDLISVRAEKAPAKQAVLCFWCDVPLRTHPPMYDRRSAPSSIHLQLHVKRIAPVVLHAL